MTVGEVMTKKVKAYMAKKDWSHDVWTKRQADYKQIKERDSYGYKSAKVQDMERVES